MPNIFFKSLEVLSPINGVFMELSVYLFLGLIILVNLVMIIMTQRGYQIKVGNTVIVGSSRTAKRKIVTIFGYEISMGGRYEDN